ncbi:MAG: XRE family transcriptional regulator [Gammaproteobacteria bacterium]|nr:MAG: XRE family transcriptional regulator [Gammaproteobacteria bacterium]
MPWPFSPQLIKIHTMEKHMNNTQLKALATKIKEVRIANNLSQEQLALIANVDRSFISRLERGIANPSYLMLLQIANALKKSIKEILPD